MDRLYQALKALRTDLTVAEFLETHFADQRYSDLRRRVTRVIEGYDAADAHLASTLALRDEWIGSEVDEQGWIVGGYSALINYLVSECRSLGAAIHLGAAVAAIDANCEGITAHCRSGAVVEADTAILTVPLPILAEIVLPPIVREKAAAARKAIGFGNVVKILLRFAREWWADCERRNLADLSFLFSGAAVPIWWTQHPTGSPVLTGWLAGPKANNVAQLNANELVEVGLTSLAEIFNVSHQKMKRLLVKSRAINWGNDPFARGAYSYATVKTREALPMLKRPDDGIVFAGEALYAGRDVGTVEAALASGRETAQKILAPGS
jgi:monoamine oxidase